MTTAFDPAAEPHEDSRRLTGCNFYFAGTGAALEAAPGVAFDDDTLARWRDNIAVARAALGWPDGEVVIRRHRSGVSLAFAAPLDQLYTATEVNEWAWWTALLLPLEGEGFRAMHAPGHAAACDVDSAMHTLRALATAEANPALVALQAAATMHGLPCLPDDDGLSLGAGAGSRTWPIEALPEPAGVDWPALHAIPTALVTGSNGKTTTVRLLAAMARAQGWHTAHSCTDGVFLDGQALESGDYSGPTGARTALRQPLAQAAVLETARGGMLRRGLALCRADAAVVTNVAADHFGEYGVHDLDDLGAVKLTVARAIGTGGLLVLNADDAVLRRQSAALASPIGWFALDFDAPPLVAHRADGGATCGVRDGRLRLSLGRDEHDLGAIAAMPLTLGGRAAYNIANIAGAALAALALGVAPDAIATVLQRFGAGHDDNPGRLQHWRFGALEVYVDYAHNPDGLRGLLQAVGADRRDGRLAIILGHAGNREDADLRAVATTAAAYDPQLVVLKDIGGYERGRAAGEVAGIMRAALAAAGVAGEAIETQLDEVEAARRPLAWARDGDLVVLPVHELDARAKVVALLDTLRDLDWRAGMPLPPPQPDIAQ
jgi:cyanophycin synthetase